MPEILLKEGADAGREVVGFIDPDTLEIIVSEKRGALVARFTAAHELGHCLLHRLTEHHREFHVDPGQSQVRSLKEAEADRFAAQYLMPEKLVRTCVKASFGVKQIIVDERNAFWLDGGNFEHLLDWETDDLRRELAVARCGRNFQGTQIDSLHVQFRVSPSAMAIRLEELNLVRV